MGVNAPTGAAEPDAWILVLLLGILGGSIAAIAVGMPVAPESGSKIRLEKADLRAAAWKITSL